MVSITVNRIGSTAMVTGTCQIEVMKVYLFVFTG